MSKNGMAYVFGLDDIYIRKRCKAVVIIDTVIPRKFIK